MKKELRNWQDSEAAHAIYCVNNSVVPSDNTRAKFNLLYPLKLPLVRQTQDEVLRSIADTMGWKVCFVDTQEDADAMGMPLKEYLNNSFIGYEIIIGKYDNLEYRFASFFHELGHIKNVKGKYEIGFSKYEVEKRCWICGFKLMEAYGYKKADLSKDTLRWCAAKNFTYFFSELKWDIPWYSKVLRILNNIMWFFR